MRITPRASWGALAPRKSPSTVAPSRRRYFIVHHSGAPVGQSVAAIQHWCMFGRGFSDIDYNFLVRGDTGEIYEGRGWNVVGAHTTGYNTTGVGVCVIGNDVISDAAKESVRWLYAEYVRRCGRELWIRGHRDLATTGTSCPGDTVYRWVVAGMPAPGKSEPIEPAENEDEPVKREEMQQIADLAGAAAAEAVWRKALGTKASEARWPGAGTKSMSEYLMLAAMHSKDALSAVLNADDTPAELADAVIAALTVTDLEAVLRRGMTEGDRKALAAALAA